jgi:hypothetical protein
MIEINARAGVEDTPLNRARRKFKERPFGKVLFAAFNLLTKYQGEAISNEADPDIYLRGKAIYYPFAEDGYNVNLVTAGDISRLAITKPNPESEKPEVVFAVEVIPLNRARRSRGLTALDKAQILKANNFEVTIDRTTNTQGSPEADLYQRMNLLIRSSFDSTYKAKKARTVAPNRQDTVLLAS